MGQLGGAGKNGGKEGKTGIFSPGSLGSAGKRRKETPPGIYQREGVPALQLKLGAGSTSRWKTEENPADVEETHGRAGNPAGMGFVYWEKEKFGMRGITSHLLCLV